MGSLARVNLVIEEPIVVRPVEREDRTGLEPEVDPRPERRVPAGVRLQEPAVDRTGGTVRVAQPRLEGLGKVVPPVSAPGPEEQAAVVHEVRGRTEAAHRLIAGPRL